MLYLLALLIPPLPILLSGRIISATLNAIIWLLAFPSLFFFGVGVLLWFVAAIHACLVVSGDKADRRNKQLIKAMNRR